MVVDRRCLRKLTPRAAFFDEVEVMSSMAKPKKLSILGSNGQVYTFLGKRDDLRKDGRLMDFNAILNKLLMKDSDSRRRQLSTCIDLLP